ncbi:MAG TPA: ABC transporter permease, partial [Anaerolineaceae bacterium]|nr:ABC transporter permease [Anaerolineaceae bacterium]
MRGQFLLALRYLTRRKQRLVLTTLAIIFGVAVLFGMNAMLPGVMTAFRHTMVTAAGKVDLSVSSLSNNPFDQSALEQLKDIPGISVSTGILQRNVLLPASLGGTANPLTGSAAIVLNGIDVESATRVRKYQVDSGRFLETSDEKGVVLGYSLAKRMGLEPGDGLTLPSSQGSVDLTVVGILSQFTSSTVDEAYVTLPTAQQILLLPGRITNIDLLLDSGADKALVSRAILAKLGSDFKMGAVEVGNELEDMLALGQNVMWLFGIMALITAGFIIFNTFRTIVAER